jgi:hypothetical protein
VAGGGRRPTEVAPNPHPIGAVLAEACFGRRPVVGTCTPIQLAEAAESWRAVLGHGGAHPPTPSPGRALPRLPGATLC